MIKRTDVHLVATRAVTLNTLVLVRMVQSLNSGVTFATLYAPLAVIPPQTVLEGLAVFGCVLKQISWPSEVARVMCVDATLGVVTIFLRWAPASFVEEHIKDVALFLCVDFCEPLVQVVELQQALGYEVIFYTLVLEVSVHGFYELEVG